jgi:hypothetical protein
MFILPFGIGLFALLCLVMWVYALVDIIKSRFSDENTKIVWILIVILIPFLGTILYFVLGREQRR